MITENPIFGLAVGNLPIINIRQEFALYLALMSDETFLAKLRNMRGPIELPHLIWRDLPKNLITYMIQRTVLGVEACVGAAIEYQLTARQLFDEEAAALLNDPAKIPGPRGMAEMFYNNMPAMVDKALQLKLAEPELWLSVQRFYKEVRNPLFHGYQLQPVAPANVREALKMFEKVYVWMDRWWGAFTLISFEESQPEQHHQE